jgi:CRP/FNR family cyclic AMP-dependent transcriptional regulator
MKSIAGTDRMGSLSAEGVIGVELGKKWPLKHTVLKTAVTALSPPYDLGALLKSSNPGWHVEKCRKHKKVFSQGDPAVDVFYILQGRVTLSVLSSQGKEAAIAGLSHDEFFGENCVDGQRLRIATAATTTDSIIVRMKREADRELIRSESGFAQMFITHILHRSLRIQADLVDQLFNSSERRLARLLLLMANFGQDGKPQPLIENISQETLAEMIGTTRSRVSFFMNKFRKMGLIDYGNGSSIEVHKSLLNLVLHEKPQITA